jgi:SpoVK/Ycf46/Vps4 family AAA+-type ATPase
MFNKSKFQSNRTLDNVYLHQIDELKQRVDFFMKRRDWYDSKGIPHTLGIVMYGHPGCGKTSTIKAIANETKRHIFNIALSEIKTKEALKDLFYNDAVNIYLNGKMEVLNIPIKQRVYVIEDIDAMDSVVIKRTAEQQKKEEEKKIKIAAEVELLKQTQGMDAANRMLNGKGKESSDSLDLATLLNVLDGVRETPGRIIVLSTNYPERLDEALLRPGRFDMMIEFEKHSCEVLKQHIQKYYSMDLTQNQLNILDNKILHHKWTPAEVSQILFRNINAIDKAIHDLVHEEPSKLFKFSQMNKKDGQEVQPEQPDQPEEEKQEQEEKEEQSTDLQSLLEEPVKTDQKKKI